MRIGSITVVPLAAACAIAIGLLGGTTCVALAARIYGHLNYHYEHRTPAAFLQRNLPTPHPYDFEMQVRLTSMHGPIEKSPRQKMEPPICVGGGLYVGMECPQSR